MRHHLLVVSEKKIKMLKTSFVIAQVKYYRWRHNSFLRLTHLGHNMAASRRSREIDQSTQRFHVGCDNRCLLGNEYGGLHGREFLGKTLIFTG